MGLQHSPELFPVSAVRMADDEIKKMLQMLWQLLYETVIDKKKILGDLKWNMKLVEVLFLL